ncbi:trypsin-like peptidase domain-containing protein [Streptomyces sp. NBC_00704]|nr:trypsin-like peptidase domain-containing protein [Streptomyces sp. NBC_00704]
MHDPDPYSTPPYGEPGPWAPAPPVQHPAVAPLPVAPPPGNASQTAGAAAPPHAAPSDAAPSDAAAPHPAAHPAGPETQPGPLLGALFPAPSPIPTPAPGPALPSQPAAPGLPSQPAAPALPSQPAAPTPPSSPALPSSSTLPSSPTPPSSSTPPSSPTPPSASAPVASAALPVSPVPGSSSPQAVGLAPADPWLRYDPWSASPFGGSGRAGSAGEESGGARERRRRVRRRLVGGALAVALVSGGLGGAVGAYLERNGGLRPIRLPQASADPGRPAEGVAGIAARALPGVVTLHVSGGGRSGTGTGFVLDSLGYILTNNHVVESAKGGGGISVVFEGGKTVAAEVVGRDSGYDLAVVRVTGVKGLRPLYLGNSDDVRVGDPVVAIGAPFDLEGTVTSGIISARERPVVAGGGSGDASDVSYVDALQTDAPINPGNSGGPLLDARGWVIGVNSAIRSGSDGVDGTDAQGGSVGLGFAIPINQGKRVAEELINTGRATHPVIGVSLDMDYAGDGARVSATGADGKAPVTPGGPGDRAGIRAGDVITGVDGRRVHTGGELIVRTRSHRPGDRLELTVERAGRERTLTLVLGSSGGG